MRDLIDEQLKDLYRDLEFHSDEMRVTLAGLRLFYRCAVDLRPLGYVQVGFETENARGEAARVVVEEYDIDGLGNVAGRHLIHESGQLAYSGYRAVLGHLQSEEGSEIRIAGGRVLV